MFRRILLEPLGIIVLLFVIFWFGSKTKITPVYIFLAMFMYCFIVSLSVLMYGKVYQRIRIDENGLHTGKVTIRWEKIAGYHLEELTFRYQSFWKFRTTVVGINCGERDHFRSHTRNCLYFPLNHKTLTAIQFYSQGRSGAMSDLIENYLSVVGK